MGPRADLTVSTIKHALQTSSVSAAACRELVDSVARSLSSARWQQRLGALRVFTNLSHVWVTAQHRSALLSVAWNDWQPDVRAAAGEALGSLGDVETAVESVRERLADPLPGNRSAALESLASVDESDMPTAEIEAALLAALHDDSAHVRAVACAVAAHRQMRTLKIADRIAACLTDASDSVRHAAARALAQTTPPGVAEAEDIVSSALLMVLRFESDERVLRAALKSLQALPDWRRLHKNRALNIVAERRASTTDDGSSVARMLDDLLRGCGQAEEVEEALTAMDSTQFQRRMEAVIAGMEKLSQTELVASVVGQTTAPVMI